MNQRNNHLQYIAVGIGITALAFGLYWYGDSLYRSAAFHLLPPGSTSTVTISAERLTTLQTEATSRQQNQPYSSVDRFNIGTSTTEAIDVYEASVIGRPPQSPYDTLIIDIGHNSGIQVGSGAWWPPGVYLGQIVDVRQRTAVVELVSSHGVKHPAFVDSVPIVTEGRGGDALYAELPQNIEVSTGTAVISDVYEMPIGVVSEIEELPTTNMQALYIARFISNTAIEHVYVER